MSDVEEALSRKRRGAPNPMVRRHVAARPSTVGRLRKARKRHARDEAALHIRIHGCIFLLGP
jgi:hypothetical protein